MKRHGPRHHPVDPRRNGRVPLAPVYVPRPKCDADVMAAAHLILPAAKDHDMEICEDVQEADLVDIEMEDDFLPQIPVIIVSIFLTWL